MFRGEWLVFVKALDPENPSTEVKVQLLVDQREVVNVRGTPRRHDPADGWLRVTVAGHEGEFARLVLPQPAQPLGENILVPEGVVTQEPKS
jgi:hypothetical protein